MNFDAKIAVSARNREWRWALRLTSDVLRADPADRRAQAVRLADL